LSLVVFFTVWQVVAASGIWNQTFVPYPSTVWSAFLDVSTTHDGVRGYAGYLLAEHLYMTLRRVFAGVIIGVAFGVLLGLVMGSVGWVRSVLEPWLTFLRALPPLAYFFLHASGAGRVAARRGRHHRRGGRRSGRAAGGRACAGCVRP
jgi:taurine transport system permease protein